MGCDKYWKRLSARLDGVLTEEEERELEEHLAVCPDCRAVGAQMAALQGAFAELEGEAPPEGFAQGVMDRVRALEGPKVIPLWKRPHFRALAGLAACLVLVVGIYGASQHQEKMMLMTRSFQHDVLVEEPVDGAGDASACESLGGEGNSPRVNAALASPEPTDAPQITAAYSAPQADVVDGTAEKTVPEDAASENYGPGYLDRDHTEAILTLDRMPEGGWELIPPETPVSPDGLTVSVELMEQLAKLAEEQGITASRTSWPVTSDHCLIVILNEES